ncbi:MAG: hypothetical protein KDD25_06540 [Bdellovibrionales bacterium]|nr:hypothetical protein [Bdellovibrionales bacterium]
MFEGLKVLALDDEADFGDMLVDLLGGAGIQIRVVQDPRELISAMDPSNPMSCYSTKCFQLKQGIKLFVN